ncbi:MAG: glycine oxidase ThiO [Spongiibacter sp.]|nr:glycine oxidase ThiO [Spongiibacter sp.]
MTQSIAIAGAGLLGRLMAWKLVGRGHSVTLFDSGSRHGELSAARVAASMLAPYTEVASAERRVFDWGLQALDWWPGLVAELIEATGRDIACARDGSVVVAHDLDKANLRHFQQQLQAVVPDQMARVESLSRARLAELEPELAARFNEGLYLPDEGYLDNTALLAALTEALTAGGVNWCEHTSVSEVAPGQVKLEGGWKAFDWAIDCRGLGAKDQLTGLRGVRGEVLWLHAPEVDLTRPVRLMHPRYKLYVSPRPGRRYVIGATEIESESMAPVTVRSNLELLSALYSLHSGFAEATVEHAFAHCRPAMPDNLPVVQGEAGLLRINGLYRHGYLLSPHVVETALARFDEMNDLRRVSA